MFLTGSENRSRGAHRAVPSAAARRNTWVLRVVGLSAGGLAVGMIIGLTVAG